VESADGFQIYSIGKTLKINLSSERCNFIWVTSVSRKANTQSN